ncbi:MAG: hypothetical protein V4621_04005 [Pseudomonadota bacterium]
MGLLRRFTDGLGLTTPGEQISLKDVPVLLRPMAAPLLATGLMESDAPAKPTTAVQDLEAIKVTAPKARPGVMGLYDRYVAPQVETLEKVVTAVVKPVVTPVINHAEDRQAGLPTRINMMSMGNPVMLGLDVLGAGPSVRAGLADMVGGTAEGIAALLDMGRGKHGDQGWSGATGQFFEEQRRAIAKYTGDGDYGIYNAATWQHGGKEGGLTSIFVRNADGKVQMLAPDQAEYWQHMGPYTLPLAVSMFTGGGEIKGLQLVFKGASTAELGGAAYMIGQPLTNGIVLAPEAMDKLAALPDNPALLADQGRMRDFVNRLYGDYTGNQGSFAGQTYIPSVQDTESPYTALRHLSMGSLPSYKRDTPFDSFADKPLTPEMVVGLRDHIAANPSFQASMHGLALRTMTGDTLSAEEMTVLRFGLNVMRNENLSLDPGQLTAADRAATLQAVRMGYGENVAQGKAIAQAVATNTDEMAASDAAGEAFKQNNGAGVTDAEIVAEITRDQQAAAIQAQQQAEAEAAEQAARIQAQSRMMAIPTM